MKDRTLRVLQYELRRSAVVGVAAAVLGGVGLTALFVSDPSMSKDEGIAIVAVPLVVAYVLFKLFAGWVESLPKADPKSESELSNALVVGLGACFAAVVMFVGAAIDFLITSALYLPLGLKEEAATMLLRYVPYSLIGAVAMVLLGVMYFLCAVLWMYRDRLLRLGVRAASLGVLVEAEHVRRVHRRAA
jgi:hypothetical protein